MPQPPAKCSVYRYKDNALSLRLILPVNVEIAISFTIMTQSTSFWQKFSPRRNRSHFLWLLLGVVSFIFSVVGITVAILEHRSSHGVLGTIVKIDVSSDKSNENKAVRIPLH